MNRQQFLLYRSLLIAAIVCTILSIVTVSTPSVTPPMNGFEWTHAAFLLFFSGSLLLFSCFLYVCVLAIVVRALRTPANSSLPSWSHTYNRGHLRVVADQRRRKIQLRRRSRKSKDEY